MLQLYGRGESRLNHRDAGYAGVAAIMSQENTDKAIYLLINTGNDKKVEKFRAEYNKQSVSVRNKIKLIVVDSKPKESASKA